MNKEELKLQQEREIQDLLSQPYSTENWLKIAQEVFPGVTPLASPKQEAHQSDKVESFKQIGNVRLNDGKNLAMFEVKVAANVNIPRNRVELRNLLAKFIDQEKNHGVLVIYEQGKEDYRFTFTSKSSEVDEETSAEIKKETDPKRYTYLLGKNQKCRTAAKRLYSIKEKKDQGKNIEIGDIVNAFNVGELNDEFFKGYRKIYGEFTKAVTGLDENMKGSGRAMKGFSAYFPGETEKAKKEARDFIKKMMGRIVFLYFVQKKGWMGVPNNANWGEGDLDFMKRLFDATKDKNSFYSNVLVPLFYKNLNTERTDSIIDLKKGLFDDKSILETKVPYLNGGLFANDKPNTDDLIFPGEEFVFNALFDFLDKYNFTIDEDNELDHTVAVDPEMLGHIFENLLEDNKEKGAFYTPKEIVHYMCQESLTEYLFTTLMNKQGINDSDLRENIAEFIIKDDRTYIEGKEKYIAQALYDVKICDPAIGSGAFPIGLLHEIYEAIVSLKNIKEVKDIWELKGDEFDEAKIKSQIIRNSIYGVDIENGAVDIARLRFWLSLIINEVEPNPLPNLDYKIMQGNSLLESFGEIDLSVVPQKPKPGEIPFDTEGDGFTVEDVEKLKSEVDTYFNEADPKLKQKLKKDINKTIIEFIRAKVNGKKEVLENEIDRLQINLQSVKRSGAVTVAAKTKKEKAIAKLKIEIQIVEKRIKELLKQQSELIEMEESQSHNFFIWHLWFADVFENGGFDIVVGNPPYIQLQKMINSDSYVNQGYETYSKSSDIYCLFYEKGINVLRENGILCYITSNSWQKTKYGFSMRKFFIEKTNPIILINFDGVQIFDTAIVESNILITQKTIFRNKLKVLVLDKMYSKSISIKSIFNNHGALLNDLDNEGWIIGSSATISIKLKIESNATKLKNLPITMDYGVKTGLNEAFIIDQNKRNEIISLDKNSKDLIKPILRGRDIKKYCCNYSNLYLITTFPSLKINIDKYPVIRNHLLSFGKQRLMQSGDKGSRKKTGNKWFETQDQISYYDNFNKEKLFWIELSDKAGFHYDANKYYPLAGTWVMTGKNLKYILAILNSKLGEWYFTQISTSSGMGTTMWKKYKVEQMPIKNITIDKVKSVEKIVDQIIDRKSSGKSTVDLELRLDAIVYKIYDLNYDEILLIDQDFPFTQEELTKTAL